MANISPRASTSSHSLAPLHWPGPKDLSEAVAADWIRKIVGVINGLMVGRYNAVGTVTLAASVASTTLTDLRIGRETLVLLTPTTANASAEIGNGTIYQTYKNADKSNAVINHANNAQTDRTFAYALWG